MKCLFSYLILFDAPTSWGIYFQDSARPQKERFIELHDNILFYLVLILFAVGWIMFSLLKIFIFSIVVIYIK